MRKSHIILSVALLLYACSSVYATTLTDTLIKRFKTDGYPEKEVHARITLKTQIPDIEGDQVEASVLLAYRTQAKLVTVFKTAGWGSNDPMLVDTLDAGVVELELDKGMNLKLKETLRLKAYVYQCEFPERKYRGGSLEKFLEKDVMEKAEVCFVRDEKLQGKGYPYYD